MEQRLADGRDFMLGKRPGLPDALCYYIVWFIRGRYSKGPEFLARFAKLCAWEERVGAIGHGSPSDMDAAEALDIARAAEPATPAAGGADDPRGFTSGDLVEILVPS